MRALNRAHFAIVAIILVTKVSLHQLLKSAHSIVPPIALPRVSIESHKGKIQASEARSPASSTERETAPGEVQSLTKSDKIRGDNLKGVNIVERSGNLRGVLGIIYILIII